MNLAPEVKLCFDLVKAAIGDRSPLNFRKISLKDYDLNLLKELLSYHELEAIFSHYFKSEIHLLGERNVLKNIAVNLALLEAEFWRIKEEMDEAGIEVIPLKGLDILFRKENLIRPMVDIDLLIKKDDIEKCEVILKELGYKLRLLGFKRSYWLKRQYHLEFSRWGGDSVRILFHVELHWKLDITRERDINLPFWGRIRIVEFNSRKVRVLSSEDSLIALTLHQRHFGKMFCLKYVIDIGFFIKNYNLDLDYILTQIEKNRLQNLFYYYFYQFFLIYRDKQVRKILNKLRLNIIHKKSSQFLIRNMLTSAKIFRHVKYFYLISHFLFHENTCQAIKYLLFLPQEQFAKFYNLAPYTNKTFILYSIRPVVFLFRLVKGFF
jgi:hypothetical protein